METIDKMLFYGVVIVNVAIIIFLLLFTPSEDSIEVYQCVSCDYTYISMYGNDTYFINNNIDYTYKYTSPECFHWGRVVDSLTNDYVLRNKLKKLMYCESRCIENIKSKTGSYIGLFQFDNTTWNEKCAGNINDGYHQIYCAMMLINNNELFRFPTCGAGL